MSLYLDNWWLGITSVLVIIPSNIIISCCIVNPITGNKGICSMELHVDISPHISYFSHFRAIDSNLKYSCERRSPKVFIITRWKNGNWIKIFPEFKNVEKSLGNRYWSFRPVSRRTISVPRVHMCNWPSAVCQVRIGKVWILRKRNIEKGG